MDKESFSFVVYMIHTCADKWGLSPAEVYEKLKRTGCISEYLVPFYDVLHTQGSNYVVEDIQKFLSVRGYSS